MWYGGLLWVLGACSGEVGGIRLRWGDELGGCEGSERGGVWRLGERGWEIWMRECGGELWSANAGGKA